MLLDIIVPHYNEPWEVVKPFVDMIHNQKGVDFDEFRVTIIHDGVDLFPDKYLEGPANIRQIWKPNAGVSSARNIGLLLADATWVNFSDCDDCFSSVFSLYILLATLRTNDDYDLFWSPFWMIKGTELKIFNKYNSIFIHNKYYRRSFLMEKKLRFCEKLFMSEDSAFNAIVETRLPRVGTINVDMPLYVWCRRKGSITMSPNRWLKNAEGHFDLNLYVLEESRKSERTRPDLLTGRTLTDAYAMINIPGIKEDPVPFLKRVAEFYHENREVFRSIPEENLIRMLKMSDLEAGTSEKIQSERPKFQDWLDEIEKKYC